jgi:hypothetical protein
MELAPLDQLRLLQKCFRYHPQIQSLPFIPWRSQIRTFVNESLLVRGFLSPHHQGYAQIELSPMFHTQYNCLLLLFSLLLRLFPRSMRVLPRATAQ